MTDDKEQKEKTDSTDTPPSEAEQAGSEAPEELASDSEYQIIDKHGGRRWVWAVVVLVVLIAAGEGAFIWWYDQQLRQSFAQTRSTLQQEMARLSDAQQRQRRQLESELRQMRDAHGRLQANLQNLLQRNQHLRKDWLLLEAEYLVKLANHRLLLEEDVNTAVVALEAADKRLKQTGDPGAIKLRERLARDIQALRSVPRADVTGISLKLSALYESIDNLPLTTPDPRRLQDKPQTVSLDREQLQQWSELPAAIWEDLKSLIVIRQHDQAVEPLLSPEQRFFLIENIRLQLEQARLALLGDEPGIYFQRLERVEAWLSRYFDTDATAVTNAIETVKALQGVTLKPELPDLSATYQAVHEYQQQAVAGGEDGDAGASAPAPVAETQAQDKDKDAKKAPPGGESSGAGDS